MGVTSDSKAVKPVALISELNWNLVCLLVFLWREENRRTLGKTLGVGKRTNNQLNPQVTPGPGIQPAGPQRWEVSALTTVQSCIPSLLVFDYIVSLKVSNLLFSFNMIFTEDSRNNDKNYFPRKKNSSPRNTTLLAKIFVRFKFIRCTIEYGVFI